MSAEVKLDLKRFFNLKGKAEHTHSFVPPHFSHTNAHGALNLLNNHLTFFMAPFSTMT